MARWNKKWSEATVVAGLKAFYGRPGNTPGSPAPESLEVANPPLIGGARRVFGSLKAAMEAAGLPYPLQPPSPWNESNLFDALRKMHAEGRGVIWFRRDETVSLIPSNEPRPCSKILGSNAAPNFTNLSGVSSP